jgi:hypothetical protein
MVIHLQSDRGETAGHLQAIERANKASVADRKHLATRLPTHASLYVLDRRDYHAVAQVSADSIMACWH